MASAPAVAWCQVLVKCGRGFKIGGVLGPGRVCVEVVAE
jgi:hypothetical protein